MSTYYNPEDLEKFGTIGEEAPQLAEKFSFRMAKKFDRLEELSVIPDFKEMIRDPSVKETAVSLEVMQINLGRLCNLACKHCHVEAGPNRSEVMSREVMEACLAVFAGQGFKILDITGGAPEMNPHFEWFVAEASKICSHIIVRTNLVVLEEEKYCHLLELYKKYKVELICSVPYYRAKEMDRVRGSGTFDGAIRILRKLNELGYGSEPDLVLNMVYNPAGAFFPPVQEAMEREYKEKLGAAYGIVFNQLFTITNNPVGRFRQFLETSDNLTSYMKKLYDAFNGAALPGMMCRFQLSVGYDGRLYDCDFNQAAGLPICSEETIFDLVGQAPVKRQICFGRHCYACTAGQGSSCGGATG